MLSELIAALKNAHLDMNAEEIADALWLAVQITFPKGERERVWNKSSLDSQMLENTSLNQPYSSTSPNSSVTEASTGLSLHTHHTIDDTVPAISGAPFKSPTAPALPNTLVLARALRPFMRRFVSKTATVFNERATVQRIAESKTSMWLPIFDPAPTRRFDIELVVDVGVSMLFWKESIASLQSLLEHLGAFRNVRVWRLSTDDKDHVDLYIGEGHLFVRDQVQARNPKELINLGGQRLILMVSDCISPAWHSGKVQELLDLWGQKNLVTLLQMLPQRLWPQTTLEHADIVYIFSSQSGTITNRSLQIKKTLKLLDESISTVSYLPLPIVTLDASSLSSWASIFAGTKKIWVIGAIFEQVPANIVIDNNLPHIQVDADALSPKERVQLFRVSSSSLARKLVGLLAAAPIPISLPIVRLIQSTMLQEATQIHIAEVFLSGLLEEIYHYEDDQDFNQIQYDFITGVRSELISAVPVPDAYRVLNETSQFVRDRYGQQRDFQAFIAASQGRVDQDIVKGSSPFAYIELSALRRFGGAFASLVDRLEVEIKRTNKQRNENYQADGDSLRIKEIQADRLIAIELSRLVEIRQAIMNIEYVIDTTSPGVLTVETFKEYMDIMNEAIITIRQSNYQFGGKRFIVLENLREVRINIQLVIDELYSTRRANNRYKYISLVRAELREFLDLFSEKDLLEVAVSDEDIVS